MKCPVDGATLNMTERNGVEIDFCPTCRGVWLDRGELDKIIAAAAPMPAPVSSPMTAPMAAPDPRRDDYRDARRWRDDDDDDDDRYRKRKKRDSFLSDLFDF